MALNECLQLTFHQACRHHLVLLYPREVLVLDLDINQTVGIIPMERTGSPFVQVEIFVIPLAIYREYTNSVPHGDRQTDMGTDIGTNIGT